MSRRRKPKEERREKMIGVHLTDEEYERVRELAFAARKSLAAFARDRVLAEKRGK